MEDENNDRQDELRFVGLKDRFRRVVYQIEGIASAA
jgi:hypothetical protein